MFVQGRYRGIRVKKIMFLSALMDVITGFDVYFFFLGGNLLIFYVAARETLH